MHKVLFNEILCQHICLLVEDSTTTSGNYKYHYFNSSGTFTINTTLENINCIDYILYWRTGRTAPIKAPGDDRIAGEIIMLLLLLEILIIP